MTLDDLLNNFYNAAAARHDAMIADRGAFDDEECDRAGVAAVVRAVRDELICVSTLKQVERKFEKILGDAGEKVAGGPVCEDGRLDNKVEDKAKPSAPAAIPLVQWLRNACHCDEEVDAEQQYDGTWAGKHGRCLYCNAANEIERLTGRAEAAEAEVARLREQWQEHLAREAELQKLIEYNQHL